MVDVEEINRMDEIQKLSVYMHYFINCLALKYGYRFSDAVSFEDFISDLNIEIRDCGEKWKENGFAKRSWIVYHGIYDWYWKFKDEIKLI